MDELKSILSFQDICSSLPFFFCFSSKCSTNLIFQKVILFCFSILHWAPLRLINPASLVTKLPQTLLIVNRPICHCTLTFVIVHRSSGPHAK